MEQTQIHAEVGQVWEDEDGLRWRIVAIDPSVKWLYLKRHGYPMQSSIQTNPAWLERWTRIS